jgi:hypothetical protein
MTSPTNRIITVVATVAFVATGLGCGVISQVKQAAGNISTVSDLADKLRGAEKLTYTAQYKVFDGSTATVVQQPPNAAFIGKDGRFLVTADANYLCSTQEKVLTCQKSPNDGATLDASSAGLIPAVTGAGFISAPIALGLLVAASVVPGAKVDKSEKKIAGQQSTCLKVTGIPQASGAPTTDVRDFSVCVTDNGLLASFEGTQNDGQRAGVELTSYQDSADAKAFVPPAGAKIVDVQELQPK